MPHDLDADVIYDAVFAIADKFISDPPLGVPTFNSISSTPMLVIPADTDLPRLGIYMRETAREFTEGIAADPQFWNTLYITFSGVLKLSDAGKQFTTLRKLMSTFNNYLLTYPTFNALGAEWTGWNRKFSFQQFGETAIAELQLEHTFEYRTVFPPNITDDYKQLHIDRRVHGSAGDTTVHVGTYDENGNILPPD